MNRIEELEVIIGFLETQLSLYNRELRQLDDGFITLTEELIRSGATLNGNGWNQKQMACLGLTSYPPVKGWIDGLVGARISISNWNQFLRHRNKPKKSSVN